MDLMKKDLVMTSREVAEITGKRHADVMRDIRSEIESLELGGLMNESIFALVKYEDAKGEMRDIRSEIESLKSEGLEGQLIFGESS